VPWTVTVRRGPKVRRARFDDLQDALHEVESSVRALQAGSPSASVQAGYRRFEPEQRVAARVELSGPERLLSSVHAGIDVRGDGTTEAYSGRVRKALLERSVDESACEALRRALAPRADRSRSPG